MTALPGEDVGRQLSNLLPLRLVDGTGAPGRALAVLPGSR